MFLRILRWIWQAFAFGPIILFNYFHWMIRYSRHPEKYPLELRYKRVRKFVKYIMKVFVVRFHIEGLENLENIDGNFLIIPNHRSNFDALVIIAISPKPVTFLSKSQARKYPFIGRCVRALEGAFFDRGDLKQQINMMKIIKEDMLNNKDHSWVVFPEGTRNKNKADLAELLPFHGGSFKAPFENDFTIIPASLNGTHRVLSLEYFRKIPIECRFAAPFKTSELENINSGKELAAYTQEIVQKNLIDLVELDQQYLPKRKRKKRAN